MENTIDKNAEALERASRALSSFAFDHGTIENSSIRLWEIFEDSFIWREEDNPVPDIAERFSLYNDLRKILDELGKVEWRANHTFKITYEPLTPSQS